MPPPVSGLAWFNAAMRIVGVDERDSSWELSRPRFRVYLHDSQAEATRGGTATFDVLDADVLQTIDWAQRQVVGNMAYAVALVYDDAALEELNPGHGRGLVWLVGCDGNDVTSEDAARADAQERMLQRRRDPVQIPTADRAPIEAPTVTPPRWGGET